MNRPNLTTLVLAMFISLPMLLTACSVSISIGPTPTLIPTSTATPTPTFTPSPTPTSTPRPTQVPRPTEVNLSLPKLQDMVIQADDLQPNSYSFWGSQIALSNDVQLQRQYFVFPDDVMSIYNYQGYLSAYEDGEKIIGSVIFNMRTTTSAQTFFEEIEGNWLRSTTLGFRFSDLCHESYGLAVDGLYTDSSLDLYVVIMRQRNHVAGVYFYGKYDSYSLDEIDLLYYAQLMADRLEDEIPTP